MEKITLTVSINGNEVSRDYVNEKNTSWSDQINTWGERVVDMLDTLEKSKEVKF